MRELLFVGGALAIIGGFYYQNPWVMVIGWAVIAASWVFKRH